MDVLCRLYGHDWRHPGTYTLVLSETNGPVHPLECQRCAATMDIDRRGNGWQTD